MRARTDYAVVLTRASHRLALTGMYVLFLLHVSGRGEALMRGASVSARGIVSRCWGSRHARYR